MKTERNLLELGAKAAKLAVWAWQIQTDEWQWSQNSDAILGLAVHERVNTFDKYMALIYFADRERVREAIQRCIASGEEYEIDYRILLPTGEMRWLEGQGQLISSASGTPMQMIGTLRDITLRKRVTERKQAEEALRQAARENSLLVATIDNAPVGVSISDVTQPDNPLVFVNPTFLQMTGYSKEDFIGRNCRFLQGPETNPETVAQIRQAIRKKEPIMVEILNYRKDGTPFWNLLGIKPLFDETGKLTHFIGMQTDITQRKMAEKLLREAKEAAEAASRAKSEFISNMSHELRTPLNGILGYAQLLKANLQLGAAQKSEVNQIYQSGSQLLTLIDDILDFSEIDSRQIDLHLSELQLAPFLQDMANMIKMQAEQKGIRFVYEAASQLPVAIRADAKRLRQILLHLLRNAVKFTHQGEVKWRVRLLEQKNSTCRLRFDVLDTGIGIKKTQLEKIFKPFEQLDHVLTKRAGGTGLGLTITSKLLKLMGSQIHVESQFGQGSHFWFELEVASIRSTNHLTKVDVQENQEVIEAATLIMPPASELEHIYELAILGKMSAIRQAVADIEQLDLCYAPFVQQVRQLARNFEDEKIMALIEPYLEQ